MTPEEYKELTALCAGTISSGVLHDQMRGWLAEHPPVPSVPVSELQVLVDGPDLQGGVWNAIRQLIDKHTPKPELPPNPHPQGTYLWAREECIRGRRVMSRSNGVAVESQDAAGWDMADFKHYDFIATDWEVVT